MSTSKQHTVQGLTYHEIRGHGPPSTRLEPPAAAGDIYINLDRPFAVFVLSATGWKEWVSMSVTEQCPHPNGERILFPTPARFSWVPVTGLANFKKTLAQRLGARSDSADVHVGIILTTENPSHPLLSTPRTGPQPSTSDQIRRSTSVLTLSDITSSDADADADPDPGDDSDARSSHSNEAIPSFAERCAAMHVANSQILQAVRESPGEESLQTYMFIITDRAIDNQRLIAGLEGVEVPMNTPTIHWPVLDVTTFMPFTWTKDHKRNYVS